MDKNTLKKIAKDWCKGILYANDGDAFSDLIEDGLISEDEASFILVECNKIADRITKEPYTNSLNKIVGKYYKLE